MTVTLLGTINVTDANGDPTTIHSAQGLTPVAGARIIPADALQWPIRISMGYGDFLIYQDKRVFFDDLGDTKENPADTASIDATVSVWGWDGYAPSASPGTVTLRITGAAPVDATAPTIVSSVPADNATGVAVSQIITITFSEPIQFGSGLITLRENNGGFVDLETFDVATEQGTGPGQVSISGNVLTIRPTASYVNSREYAVRMAGTAIRDTAATPNNFAGIANDTTLSFTAVAPISNLNVDFGQYTRTGAGGVAVSGTSITAGNGSGHWQITSGFLVPSATGQNNLTGTYSLTLNNGQTVGITITANEYHVRTQAELTAAITHMGAAGGRTQVLRAENISLTSRNYRNLTFAAQAAMTQEAGGKITSQFQIENAKNLRIYGVDFHWTSGTTGGVVQLIGGSDQLVFEDCKVHATYYDPLGDYSAAGSYANPNGFNAASGSGGSLQGFTIRRCEVYDVSEGIVLSHTGGSGILVEDVLIYRTYSDAQKYTITGGGLTTTKTWQRMVYHSPVGRPSDVVNPHIDLLQFVSNSANHLLAIENVTIRQYLAWESTTARGQDLQGIVNFIDGSFSAHLLNPKIFGCAFAISGNHPINVRCDGGIIGNCTMVHPSPTYPNTGTAQIKLTVINSNPPTVRYNIADRAPSNGTSVGNVVLGDKGATIPYANVFDGPFSTSVGPTSLAEMKSMFDMLANGPADTAPTGATNFGDAGALGSGYGTYGNALSSTGWTFDGAYEA